MGGILYFCDFLVTDTGKYSARYAQYAEAGQEDFGVYKTSEGALVRHHRMNWLFTLLRDFDILWLEQVDDYTMNGNAVRTVHIIARK